MEQWSGILAPPDNYREGRGLRVERGRGFLLPAAVAPDEQDHGMNHDNENDSSDNSGSGSSIFEYLRVDDGE